MSNTHDAPKAPPAAGHGHHAPEDGELDLRERGAIKDGAPQAMDRRLFMQLLVFDAAPGNVASAERALCDALSRAKVPSVVYADVSAPAGLGVLAWSDTPSTFVTQVRPALIEGTAGLTQRPGWAMLGRTYATGYEADLEFWLMERPVQTALNPAWPWAVWYPLRRIGAFNRLEPREQGGILREHGAIGKAYGAKDLAHDIRLACHGIDADDNEFVVGLVGKELHPLSHVVQSMRKTRQTAEFMEKMGPFFVGHALWRNAGTLNRG